MSILDLAVAKRFACGLSKLFPACEKRKEEPVWLGERFRQAQFAIAHIGSWFPPFEHRKGWSGLL
jgi:hypothetical protein